MFATKNKFIAIYPQESYGLLYAYNFTKPLICQVL